MEKINCIDHVRNEEVLQRVKEGRNIQQTLKGRKANWIGHILRRNCLLKHVIEGKIKKRIYVTGIRERRLKHLPDDLKEKTGYCKLEDEALERSQSIENSHWKRLWTCRKTNSRMNEWICSMKYLKSVLISCTLHFGFNYEINYQLDAIEYLFDLSFFSSTCFGLTCPSSGEISVTILTNVAYGVLGFCLVRCWS